MNEDSHQPIEPELEARIVAWVLGEASDFEREELEALIKRRSELASFKEEMQRVHGLLTTVGNGESDPKADDWKLPKKRRNAVLAALDNANDEAPGSDVPKVRLAGQLKTSWLRFSKRQLVNIVGLILIAGVFWGLSLPAIQMARESAPNDSRKFEEVGTAIRGGVDLDYAIENPAGRGEVGMESSDEKFFDNFDSELVETEEESAEAIAPMEDSYGAARVLDPMKRHQQTQKSAQSSLSDLRQSMGYETKVNGQTLPSPYYLQDDVQYFPSGPEFKLPREVAESRRTAETAKSESSNANANLGDKSFQTETGVSDLSIATEVDRSKKSLFRTTKIREGKSIVYEWEAGNPVPRLVPQPSEARGQGKSQPPAIPAPQAPPSTATAMASPGASVGGPGPGRIRLGQQSQQSAQGQTKAPSVVASTPAQPSNNAVAGKGFAGGGGFGGAMAGERFDGKPRGGEVASDEGRIASDVMSDDFGIENRRELKSRFGAFGAPSSEVSGFEFLPKRPATLYDVETNTPAPAPSNPMAISGGMAMSDSVFNEETRKQSELFGEAGGESGQSGGQNQNAGDGGDQNGSNGSEVAARGLAIRERLAERVDAAEVKEIDDSLTFEGLGPRQTAKPRSIRRGFVELEARKGQLQDGPRLHSTSPKDTERYVKGHVDVPELLRDRQDVSDSVEKSLQKIRDRISNQTSISYPDVAIDRASQDGERPSSGESSASGKKQREWREYDNGRDFYRPADRSSDLTREERYAESVAARDKSSSGRRRYEQHWGVAADRDVGGVAGVRYRQLGLGIHNDHDAFKPIHRVPPLIAKKSKVPDGLNEKSADEEAFSTFSLHVSDVSFKLARAALGKGEWPEAAKIRIEEFVNAFDYGDAMPCGDEKVACRVEQAAHPFLQQRNMLRVSMRTAAAGRASQTPLRLTFLLDNSGSMERIDRRQTVRRAFAMLAAQLKPIDQVSLISFARTPRLIADKVGGANARQLVDFIDRMPSEGGTNLESALQLAFEKAREHRVEGAQNRIILLTDGAVNLGNANPESLSQMIASMRAAGIAFDAAGISAEGLNDEVLEALTRKGDGRYYLLDSLESADDGFARQIAGALRPSAKNVKVQIEFNPRRVGRYKLLGFEKHRLKKEDFRNDKVDAAEMAAAEAGVAMYQFEAKPDGEGDVGSVSVRFRDLSSGQMIEHRWPIPFQPDAPRMDRAASSLRIASTAALLAAKLRGEPLGESVDLKTLAKIIASVPQAERASQRVAELEQMIRQARNLNP